MQSFCNFCSHQSVKKGKKIAVGGCLILRNNCVKTKDEERERVEKVEVTMAPSNFVDLIQYI